MWFGDRGSFGIEYLGEENGLVQANLFVAGQNITPLDNWHYDQFLVYGALGRTADRLTEGSESFLTRDCFNADGVEQVFRELWDRGPWGTYVVFDWPPCTSHFRCAVIPFASQIHLCCARHDCDNQIYSVVVCLNRLVEDLRAARDYIISNSANPLLKPDVR